MKGSCLKSPILQKKINRIRVAEVNKNILQELISWFSLINAFDDGRFTKTSLT
ncbi:Hypothetical protein PMN2A_2127 [Prochlorococcus marinus str. NATL2A]|uniref:Uncharacterized protein n=1 Tax=Prochlorococcus marinus (strain NATL2A) TaxID=59920 RepID=A7MDW1_PROMT|nr:Hypothetical protein PMN2A_2127 [Prochlorococcus marinus str. NATL2A]